MMKVVALLCAAEPVPVDQLAETASRRARQKGAVCSGEPVTLFDAELLAAFHDIRTGFDITLPRATLVRSRRSSRRVGNGRPVDGCVAAVDAVKHLPPEDRKPAAVPQVPDGVGWLEMRIHRNLSREQIGRVTCWAMRR